MPHQDTVGRTTLGPREFVHSKPGISAWTPFNPVERDTELLDVQLFVGFTVADCGSIDQTAIEARMHLTPQRLVHRGLQYC